MRKWTISEQRYFNIACQNTSSKIKIMQRFRGPTFTKSEMLRWKAWVMRDKLHTHAMRLWTWLPFNSNTSYCLSFLNKLTGYCYRGFRMWLQNLVTLITVKLSKHYWDANEGILCRKWLGTVSRPDASCSLVVMCPILNHIIKEN